MPGGLAYTLAWPAFMHERKKPCGSYGPVHTFLNVQTSFSFVFGKKNFFPFCMGPPNIPQTAFMRRNSLLGFKKTPLKGSPCHPNAAVFNKKR